MIRVAIRSAVILLLGSAMLPALAGCSSSATVSAQATTTGQELKDLEDARNQGLLTEAEYQKKRQQILDRK